MNLFGFNIGALDPKTIVSTYLTDDNILYVFKIAKERKIAIKKENNSLMLTDKGFLYKDQTAYKMLCHFFGESVINPVFGIVGISEEQLTNMIMQLPDFLVDFTNVTPYVKYKDFGGNDQIIHEEQELIGIVKQAIEYIK